ncbi:PLP-dependent aminotransferase family protein [Gryllotalpicola protaetiae]|uniref:PLP-dependent aminotransferase family protein n=2 Tax=Gryllotalpicola protaetiae TaxID=2419771 RepID=A0A387BFR0_9MICO|nr:PLP-dependent aminotransferase family protein [Gryllotalpicola protaetiae]
MIHDGRLRAGDALPSTRALAAELGIARGTVVAAFEQLDGEGYIHTRHGAAARVAATLAGVPAPHPAAELPAHHRAEAKAEGLIDLLPGVPASNAIARRDWRAAWRHAAAAPIDDAYPDPLGLAALRAEVAKQLGFSRGFAPELERVIVTAGTREALSLVVDALPPGARVAVENPGHRGSRQLLSNAGAHAVPIGLDEHGLVLDELRAAHARDALAAVLVTPSHQYPMGTVMPIARRHELLEWASGAGVLVIEDDYDSEFRHHGAPLPALAAIDPSGAVVLLGTFSKTLSPALRCGYLVVPERAPIADALRQVRTAHSSSVATPVQHAVAWLMSSGALRRHLARLRRDYTHKRAMVADALVGLPGVTIGGLAGGLHALVQWEGERDEASVVAGIRRRGVAVAPLARYVADGSGLETRGLVLGYGPVSATSLGQALPMIAAELRRS